MALEGRLQVRSYDGDDGKKRWVTEVVAEQIEFVGSKNDSNQNSGGNGGTGSHHGGGSGNSTNQGLGYDVEFNEQDLPF